MKVTMSLWRWYGTNLTLFYDVGKSHFFFFRSFRRQLPQIPSRSSLPNPPSTAHTSQLLNRPQQHGDNPEDFYDNEESGVRDTGFDRYSTVPTTPQNARRTVTEKPLKGTVIANTQETYDTVIDGQEPQDVYDNDPFETEQLSIRRDSNPNIYSEVNSQDKPKQKKDSKAKIDTSLVVQNPVISGGDQPKPYETLPSRKTSANQNPPAGDHDQPKPHEKFPSRKPSANQNPPVDSQSDESGEEYIDMTTSVHLTSSSMIAAEGTDGTVSTSMEKKQEVGDDRKQEVSTSQPGGMATGGKPAPYFLFGEEYDTIIHREVEKKSDPGKKNEAKGDSQEVSDAGDKATPFLELDEEYDTVVQKETENEEEQGFYLDMTWVQLYKS